MVKATQQKWFSVFLGSEDYEALYALAEERCSPLTLQYIVSVAVKNLWERHATEQLSFPLGD